MFSNGKLSDNAKRCIVWIIGICTILSCSAICVYSCKRNVQCTVNAKRNGIVVNIDRIPADGVVKKNK